MRARDSASGWGWVTRALHWTVAALILYQLALGLRMVRLDDLVARFALTQVHKSWGVVIFALVAIISAIGFKYTKTFEEVR